MCGIIKCLTDQAEKNEFSKPCMSLRNRIVSHALFNNNNT